MNIFDDGRLSDEARQLDERMAQEDIYWAVRQDEFYPADTGTILPGEIQPTAEVQTSQQKLRQIGQVAARLGIAS